MDNHTDQHQSSLPNGVNPSLEAEIAEDVDKCGTGAALPKDGKKASKDRSKRHRENKKSSADNDQAAHDSEKSLPEFTVVEDNTPGQGSGLDTTSWIVIIAIIVIGIAWYALTKVPDQPAQLTDTRPTPTKAASPVKRSPIAKSPSASPTRIKKIAPPQPSKTPENKYPDNSDVVGELVCWIGPPATRDCQSWAYVHGDIILGAIKVLDSQPDTRLSPQQITQIRDILVSSAPALARHAIATDTFNLSGPKLLTLKQTLILKNQKSKIVQIYPDDKKLIAHLKKQLPKAPTLPVGVKSNSTRIIFPSNYILAGLCYMQSTNKLAMSAADCKKMLELVTDYSKRLDKQKETYKSVVRVFTAPQIDKLLEILNAMRGDSKLINKQQVDYDTILAYLANRLKAAKASAKGH